MSDLLPLRARLGLRVAEQRRLLKLTQAALAEKVGVTTNYIARIEGGHENLTLDSLEKLAKHLTVDPVRLFEHPQRVKVAKGRPKSVK